MKYLEIHPENPEARKIQQVVEVLEQGGVIIYPTDTVYGIGCDINNDKAIQQVCRLKGIDPKKANLSFVCHDLSHLSDYTKPFDRSIYRLMNDKLPGPFTFILKASGEVPKLLRSKKKTVGIRVPDNNIAREIVRALGRPILSTSLRLADDDPLFEDGYEYPTDPEEIFHLMGKRFDLVVGGGVGNNNPSTVVDCTDSDPVLIRQGAGEIELD